MKRELRITEDGSHTLYVPEMEETYHSVHGAIQESLYIFLEQGFLTLDKEFLNILEIGFGTGLNALLTLAEANKRDIKVRYHSIEKYPLDYKEYSQLNYEDFIEGLTPGSLMKMHESPWEEAVPISDHFTLLKERSDLREIKLQGPYDLVYFDAFDPEKQAHLWTEQIFGRISSAVKPGGILLTYTSKGNVRRALISCQFDVKKVPGPPGKRHILRATRR